MSTIDKPGESLQRLVRLIEIGVANNPNVRVDSPVRLRDKDTGRLREHDVLVTINERHHQIKVALECRDRSRRVGVPEVEAFASKCHRTGIDKGIIVSSKGFTDTARAKALANEIGCFTLEAKPRFEWMGTDVFHQVERVKKSVSVRLEFGDGAKPDLARARYYFGNGVELTREAFMGLASNGLSKLQDTNPIAYLDPAVTYSATFELRVDGPEGAPYVVDENGTRFDIRGGHMDVTFQVRITAIPLEFHSYSDLLAQVGITQAATASFELQNRTSHVVLTSNDDGTKSMKIVVDKTEGS